MNIQEKTPDAYSPAVFSIRVKGWFDDNLSDYFEGMELEHQTTGNNMKITALKGKIQDQAALMGLLNLLYNMRLPILSVERLDK